MHSMGLSSGMMRRRRRRMMRRMMMMMIFGSVSGSPTGCGHAQTRRKHAH